MKLHVIPKRIMLLAVLIGVCVILVYLPALKLGFVNWDDQCYVYENSNVLAPGIHFIPWAFTTFKCDNWHPLTWLTLGGDRFLWGKRPMGFHATNIFLHGLNTVLVTILTALLIGAAKNTIPRKEEGRGLSENGIMMAAAATGILFGVHPIHVESVAWISERKDVLCAFFFLAGILTYVRYTGDRFEKNILGTFSQVRSSRLYLLTLFFFTLALLSKPMAVSFPVVLLILDWHPFGRFEHERPLPLFLEKLPFFALGFAASIVTVAAQSSGALKSLTEFPLTHRLIVAPQTLVIYLWKTMVPVSLIPYYPYPHEVSLLSLRNLAIILCLTGLVISCFVLLKIKKGRWWVATWVYFFITVLPVLGIIQVGGQFMADRYMYLPSLGPFLLTGLGLAKVIEGQGEPDSRHSLSRQAALVVLGVLLLTLSTLTVRQMGIWSNSMTLWNYVIEKEPEEAGVAYNNRGLVYLEQNRLDEALRDFDKALDINPVVVDWHGNRALVYYRLGKYDKAVEDYTSIVDNWPGNVQGRVFRGNLYILTGHPDKAIDDFDAALSLSPGNAGIYFNRGTAYLKMNRIENAIHDYATTLSLEPNFIKARYQRGKAYLKRGDTKLAMQDFEAACQMGSPDACRAMQHPQ